MRNPWGQTKGAISHGHLAKRHYRKAALYTSAVPGETLAMWETATGSLKASILQALMRLTSAQERPSRVYTDTFRQLSP